MQLFTNYNIKKESIKKEKKKIPMRKNIDSDKFKLEGETKRNQKIKRRK